MSPFPIARTDVRFIKLGRGGKWEADCLNRGILRFGWCTSEASVIDRCRSGQWDELAQDWSRSKSRSSATSIANATRTYWEDPGNTLWITFIGEDLCWGFLEPGEPVPQPFDSNDSADDSSYRTVVGGWNSFDAKGVRLGKYNLPGYITKVTGYRATVCRVEGSDRLIDRINGANPSDVALVVDAQAKLIEGLVPLIQRLNPATFEVLVEMMFSRAGWRRIGYIGKAQADKDVDLEMPLTRERAVVQVKAETRQADLDDYIERKKRMPGYDRLFFVYHTSKSPLTVPDQDETETDDVTVMGAPDVAQRVVEAGLVDWVLTQV
ncbi:restriction endonuclease [Lysobacter terrae]